MLILLTPDQAMLDWPALRTIILQSFESDPESLPNELELQELVASARLQVWVSKREGEDKVKAVVTTCFVQDTPHQTFSLLIYSLYAIRKDGVKEEWSNGVETLRLFAKEKGAKGVIFYTLNPSVATFAERLGAIKKNFYRFEVL